MRSGVSPPRAVLPYTPSRAALRPRVAHDVHGERSPDFPSPATANRAPAKPPLVRAPRPAVRRHALGSFFQPRRAAGRKHSVLLLVSVRLDRRQRGAHGRGLLRYARRGSMSGVNATAVIVFVALFALVTVLGFVAARWRQGNLDELHEWGLGGRRFGTLVTWFLLGGDLYTAYTFVAVPALVFGAGAIGFFALPYTVITYPLVLAAMPRLWSVTRKHGYITAADFVRGRF